MQKRYFNYDNLLSDYLNQPITQQLKNTSISMKDYEIKNNFLNKIKPKSEFDEISDLMSCEKYIDERRFEESYLFGVLDDELKIVQYSKNYLLDDLMTIQNFLNICDFDDFKTKLRKLYWINDKTKNKYIKKANRKNKETLYGNYNTGTNILTYISNKNEYNLLGERFGVENHINDLKLENPETMKHKFIIIMNFDNQTVEIYDSIPYELFQKGSEALQSESVFGSYFDDYDYQTFFNKINEY